MKTQIILPALLALALPMTAFSSDGVSIASSGADINMSLSPKGLNSDNVFIDAAGQVSVDLPFQISIDLKGRIDETLDSAKNEKLDQDFFWKTLEGLAIRKKIFYTVAVGKVDAGFGARGTGIGETAMNRQRDSLLYANSFSMRSVTGVQVVVDNEIPAASQVAAVLNQILSGITITLYDANAGIKPTLSDFQHLQSLAVRKVGKALGIDYQVSYVNAKFADGTKDQRYSISLQKCLDLGCIYGEHQDTRKSDLTGMKNATTVGVSKTISGVNLAAEYTNVQMKPNGVILAPNVPTTGTNVALIANKDVGGVTLGASMQRDLDNKENIYRLNANIKFGASQADGHLFGGSAADLHEAVAAQQEANDK